MLEKTFLNNTLENWGISVLIIIGALLLNKIIQILNRRVFRRIAAKAKTDFIDILLDSLESPVLFGVMIIAVVIALGRLELGETPNLIKAYKLLITLDVTWFFARLLASLLERSFKSRETEHGGRKKKRRLDPKFLPLTRRIVLIFVWIIGIITGLKNMGADLGAILGTLGIGGAAFALASQDLLKNLLAGVTIFVDQPFQLGDRVRFSGVDGIVEDIGLRSTRIRTLDRRLLTIPNYRIMDDTIENVNSEPMRKVTLKLGLTYDTTPEKMSEAMNLLRTLPQRVQHVSPNDLVAAFTDFGDFALGITFIYYIEKEGDIFEVTSAVDMDILSTFNAAGLNFAFPTQTIYVEK